MGIRSPGHWKDFRGEDQGRGIFSQFPGGVWVGMDNMMIIIIPTMNKYFLRKAIWCSGKNTNKYFVHHLLCARLSTRELRDCYLLTGCPEADY